MSTLPHGVIDLNANTNAGNRAPMNTQIPIPPPAPQPPPANGLPPIRVGQRAGAGQQAQPVQNGMPRSANGYGMANPNPVQQPMPQQRQYQHQPHPQMQQQQQQQQYQRQPHPQMQQQQHQQHPQMQQQHHQQQHQPMNQQMHHNQQLHHQPQMQQQQHLNLPNQGMPLRQPPAERRPKHGIHISDLRHENMTEADAREELSSYIVIRMEKAQNPNETDKVGKPVVPSWERATQTEETDISQEEATRKVRDLNKKTDTAMNKKDDMPAIVQRQIERAQESLQRYEEDGRYEYVLAQLECKFAEIDEKSPLYKVHVAKKDKDKEKEKDKKDKDKDKDKDRDRSRKGKEYRGEKEYRGDKAKQSKKFERAGVTVYFRRVPKRSEDAMEMLHQKIASRSKRRQHHQQQQQQQQHQQQHHQQQQQHNMPMGQMADAQRMQNMQNLQNMPQQMNHSPAMMPQQMQPQLHQQQQHHQPQVHQQQHHQPQVQQPIPIPIPQAAPPPPPPKVPQRPIVQPMSTNPSSMSSSMPTSMSTSTQHQRPFTPAGRRTPRPYKETPRSPRSSRDSLSSSGSWDSDEAEYTTPESSISSSSRYYRKRYSKSRHRRDRDRPEHFGVDQSSRQNTKQTRDYNIPPSPPSTIGAPGPDFDSAIQRAYNAGKEDAIRPLVLQASTPPRAISAYRGRQLLHKDRLDLEDTLAQIRIADDNRRERTYRRERDYHYARGDDDLDRDRLLGDRMYRREVVDDWYDDDVSDRNWGPRRARDFLTRRESSRERYNPMMPAGYRRRY